MSYRAGDSGRPCWYEQGAPDLDTGVRFYESVLGWRIAAAGVEGFDYRIASIEGHGVAGLMSTKDQQDSPPANWVFYVEVADADRSAEVIARAGGTVLKPPADIPGTGRFAVAADPQGAVFGILQPNPMDEAPQVGAYDPQHRGHGTWHELSTSDPQAAAEFYSRVFGWKVAREMGMGEHGTYRIFGIPSADLGGMMPLGGASHPSWRVYFDVESVEAAIARTKEAGGTLQHGPQEVPGGAWVAMLSDAQGAPFGVSSANR